MNIFLATYTLVLVMTVFSCTEKEPKPEYPLRSYGQLMDVFDRIGRQKPVKYQKVDEIYWIITFDDGSKYKITNMTKQSICIAMPQHCK